MRSFSIEQATENERCWTHDQYVRKNADMEKNNHYDWTRREINFKVALNEHGVPEISPLQSPDGKPTLHKKLQERLDVLGYKPYKEGARNSPFACVDIVIGGDQSRMREMAFGDQNVSFDLSEDNSGIRRMREIEEWAKDIYEFAREKWGTENIIGMEVHLDESTPHAHLLFVPTAMRKPRGRISKNKPKVEKLKVSFSGVWGDNTPQRSEYTSNLHTTFHEKVGVRYGLDRGDVIDSLPEEEKLERVHKNKRQLEAERISRENVKVNEQYNDTLKDCINDNETILREQNKSIAKQESKIQQQEEYLEKLGSKTTKAIASVQGALEGAKQGVSDLFTGNARKRAEEAEKRAENAEKIKNDTLAYANERIREASDAIASAKTKEKKLEDWKCYKEFELSRLNKFQDTIATLSLELQKTKSKLNKIQREQEQLKCNLPDVVREGTSFGVSVEHCIEIAKGNSVVVSRLNHPETDDVLTSENRPIILKWDTKLKSIVSNFYGRLLSIAEFFRQAKSNPWYSLNGVKNEKKKGLGIG